MPISVFELCKIIDWNKVNMQARANIMNFIRGDHGLETVVGEMNEIVKRRLPATWLLMYDALVDDDYLSYLKQNIAENHEVGLWLEICKPQCDDADVRYHGWKPDEGSMCTVNWDYHSHSVLTCGYTKEERIKLIDAAMEKFKELIGYYPQSVAAWYIDSFSLEYLYDKYNIKASANCKDQWGTDGYTLWGAPFHSFYYPSKQNAIMAANEKDNQIDVPIFRMLGNDPVNSRNADVDFNGQPVMTLEPAYGDGGGNPEWVKKFFDMSLSNSVLPFGYVQIGQENSFVWTDMADSYSFQLDELIRRRDAGEIVIETLAESGEFVHENYNTTPVGFLHANVNLVGCEYKAVWFHSPFYRCQLLYSDSSVKIVDIYLYKDDKKEHYYDQPVSTWKSDFVALPILDSFLFGSSQALCGVIDDIEFDERNLPISDISVNYGNETMNFSYCNKFGIESRIEFSSRSIDFYRKTPENILMKELIVYSGASRMAAFEGVYFNKLCFGWDNYSYMVELNAKPVYESREQKIVLNSSETNSNTLHTKITFV